MKPLKEYRIQHDIILLTMKVELLATLELVVVVVVIGFVIVVRAEISKSKSPSSTQLSALLLRNGCHFFGLAPRLLLPTVLLFRAIEVSIFVLVFAFVLLGLF